MEEVKKIHFQETKSKIALEIINAVNYGHGRHETIMEITFNENKELCFEIWEDGHGHDVRLNKKAIDDLLTFISNNYDGEISFSYSEGTE